MYLSKILIATRETESYKKAEAGAMVSLNNTFVGREGIPSDRHFGYDANRSVTLIFVNDLPEFVSPESLRRNLIIVGGNSRMFENKFFRINNCVFKFWSFCPPCGHINRVTGQNITAFLTPEQCGIYCSVVCNGQININDEVNIIQSK